MELQWQIHFAYLLILKTKFPDLNKNTKKIRRLLAKNFKLSVHGPFKKSLLHAKNIRDVIAF